MQLQFQRAHVLSQMGMLLSTLAVAGIGGCTSHYTTPGAGVSLQQIADSDEDIAERLKSTPAATFPARLALVRVQDSEYRSYRTESYGSGKYSVVTTRETERDEDLLRVKRWPMVADVAVMNRLILPNNLETDRELRVGAAALKADVVLAYSFDTRFRVDGRDIGPLGLVTLGYLPVDEAVVTTTASAALFDVRTGFVYGVAEATSRETQLTSAWTSQDVVDDARLRAERKAFEALLGEAEKTWGQVVAQHAHRGGPQAAAR